MLCSLCTGWTRPGVWTGGCRVGSRGIDLMLQLGIRLLVIPATSVEGQTHTSRPPVPEL